MSRGRGTPEAPHQDTSGEAAAGGATPGPDAPPRTSTRVRRVLELALEDTGALLAVRRQPSIRAPLEPLPPDDPDPGHTQAALRVARRLSALVGLNAALYLGVAGVCAARYQRDPAAIPEVIVAVLALGLGAWGANASRHLFRSTRLRADDARGTQSGHALADALHALRTIFVLKGTGLFLTLALACFAFSAVLSVVSLL